MIKLTSRKHLSANGLIGIVYQQFSKIKGPLSRINRTNPISLTDCLMSGFAIFSLKFPSLLKFDEKKEELEIKHNLRALYHIRKAPCDTYMRERCDEVNPSEVRKIYKVIFSQLQRGKGLEAFEYLDKHYLLAGDGTGFFSSDVVHCKNCCIKHYNQCHVVIQGYIPVDTSSYKKNTYLLIRHSKQPWELHCIDYQRQLKKIELSVVNGLQELLGEKSRCSLSKEEKATAKALIMDYYQSIHPCEEVSYYHNMFCAALVHPDHRYVLPLAPEPIMKTDGCTKNDCERNAAKRLYADARREHPHLKFIVVEDSLAANEPHLSDLKRLDMRYIVGVKPGDHQYLFDTVKTAQCFDYTHKTSDGVTHRYRYINQVPLNKSHAEFKVNFLEYWETNQKGEQQHFCWITDLFLTKETIYHIMRGGRVNWRIENNTFNTLKNQDYHFSHNFGHGYNNLCSVLGMLMMLAFFIDQIQELCCQLFKAARAKFKSRTSLWETMRGMFKEFLIHSWDDLFNTIAYGHQQPVLLTPNTS